MSQGRDVTAGTTAAAPTGPAAEPVPDEAAAICEAISGVFPDWRVWWQAGAYYARRKGTWMEVPGAPGAYAVWHASPAVFVLMLDAQDRVRPVGRWDAPARREPVMTELKSFGQMQESPIDLARDVIAARIEAEHPGWVVDHVLTGWTAVWLDDPRYQLRAQSSPELTARLPARGCAPGWTLD